MITFNFYCQINGDRYYYDGAIKISKNYVEILKGMNANMLTNSKDFDYRYMARLLKAVFSEDELRNGCVTRIDQTQRPSQYKKLDPLKFDFVKGMCVF